MVDNVLQCSTVATMSITRERLTDPIPLRLTKQQKRKATQAMKASNLKQPEVLRRAIDAGLPAVLKQFSQV